MRKVAGILFALSSTAAMGQADTAPISSPPPSTLVKAPKLPPKWEATTREIYKTAIEIPTVKGREGANLKLATYLAE